MFIEMNDNDNYGTIMEMNDNDNYETITKTIE